MTNPDLIPYATPPARPWKTSRIARFACAMLILGVVFLAIGLGVSWIADTGNTRGMTAAFVGTMGATAAWVLWCGGVIMATIALLRGETRWVSILALVLNLVCVVATFLWLTVRW
jgi:hypothetical protein